MNWFVSFFIGLTFGKNSNSKNKKDIENENEQNKSCLLDKDDKYWGFGFKEEQKDINKKEKYLATSTYIWDRNKKEFVKKK